MRRAILLGLVACGGAATPAPTGPGPATTEDPPAPDHLALGAELWAASCPTAIHGLCIEKTAMHAAPGTTCASYQVESVTSSIVAIPRDADKAAAAVEHFEAALVLDDPAELALIDRDFERAIAVPLPADQAMFDGWFKSTTEILARANEGYKALAVEGNLAASYRIGALTQWLADQLFQAPVPASYQADAELSQAYCDAMFDQAEPLEARALATFRACATSDDPEWAEPCKVELQALDPTWKP